RPRCGASSQDDLDARRKAARFHWFQNVVIRAGLESFGFLIDAALGREHEDANMTRTRIAAKRADHRGSGHPRHRDVAHDEIRHLSARDLEALVAVLGGEHLEAVELEEVPHDLENRRTVIHDEDAPLRAGGWI